MKKILIITILSYFTTAGLDAQDLTPVDHLLQDGQYGEAIRVIDEALATANPESVRFTWKNKQAEAFTRAGRYKEALATLDDLKDHVPVDQRDYYQGQLYTSYGFVHLNQGRNDLSLDALEKALSHWERAGKSKSLEAANTQSILGNLYLATGKYTQAEEQLRVAQITREKLLPPNDELIAASWNDLGLVYTFSDTDKALDYYEKAKGIYESIHGKNHPKIAIANTNIGYLYNQLELYGDAINNFESALTTWEKVYPGAHPSKGFVLFNLGQTYQNMKETKTAREFYEKAVKVYFESYQGRHPDLARVYNALGNLDQAENNFYGALTYYQKALQVNHPDFSSDDLLQNPSVKNYYDGNVLLHTLVNKAEVLELSYFRKTLRFKELLLAIRTLQSCDSLIDRIRQQITNESDKITLGIIADEVYADGVRICSEAGHAAWKKQPFYELAFFFAEKSKSAVLLNAISEANAKSFAGIPPALLEEEKTLKSAIALCAQKLALKPEPKEEVQLRQTYYDLNRSYESFSKKLETDYPSYFNLKYNVQSPQIHDLKKKLDDRTMVLAYFQDEKNQRLYLFKITRTKFDIEEKTLPADLDRSITGLRNSIFYSELNTYKAVATSLSGILIPNNIPSSIKDLVIIPASRLSTIPFEALFTERVTSSNHTFNTLPYLINRFSVRYEFSSGLILQKQARLPMDNPSILLCAPVSFAAPMRLADLPGTETEVNDIASLFSARNFTSKLLIGKEAEESTVKSEDLGRFGFIHFATHGVVDEREPELSRIFLHAGNPAEDGSLYSGEIYNLRLNANLVALSACQTGLGKISKGEGVIGLSRALLYAGARNCLVSFWKVADESTAILMKDYYNRMLGTGQHNLTSTLQEAKASLIRSERYASPFYWAPFILIGF